MALLISVFFISCGGNNTENSNEDTTAMDTTLPEVSTTTVEDTAVSNTVELTGNDQLQFNKTLIRVKAGEQVTLSLKNIGTMPKEAMAHNFILLKPGTDPEQFSLKAAVSQKTNYIPAEMESAILAHTKLVGPGESDSITFTVPKGEYEYICSFPGHWATMRGKLIAL